MGELIQGKLSSGQDKFFGRKNDVLMDRFTYEEVIFNEVGRNGVPATPPQATRRFNFLKLTFKEVMLRAVSAAGERAKARL
jgi:hypothetical protein